MSINISSDWYVREGYDTAQVRGPFSFTHAELVARSTSAINDSGVSETLVEVNGKRVVDAVFKRGRKLKQGQHARLISKNKWPPSY